MPPRVVKREQGLEFTPRLKEWEKKGGNKRRRGQGGHGAPRREKDFCRKNDVMFSTYLIWHQPPRGLFSYE